MATEERVTDSEWGQDLKTADKEALRIAEALGFAVNTPPTKEEDMKTPRPG